jgi:non-ribosomal peptide synthetase component F
MQGTPSTWQLLLDADWRNKENIKMLVGGEALKEELKEELVSSGTTWNVYGPTETTIWSTVKKLEPNSKVSIGTPIANTSVVILDNSGNLSPVGVPGEICIGGDGVARGYLNREELTAEKFIANPFNNGNSRLYKTGDVGRWLPDGNLQCLGRIDDQVKMRGYRIEPGEIENVLLQHQSVLQAVVAVKRTSKVTSDLWHI